MAFCRRCGTPTVRTVPPDDHRLREVCPACGTIHYDNPRVITGCLALWQDRVLLCRRAIAPRLGLWTLPAGFMECGEATHEAAARETWEEAGALVVIEGLHALIDVPHIDQVHVFYRARLQRIDMAPGHESLETRLFAFDAIPWEEIAFATVRTALRHWGGRTDPTVPLVQTLTPADQGRDKRTSPIA